MIQKILLLLLLGIAAYEDYRKKKISMYLILIAGITGLICHLCEPKKSITDMLLGAAVGILILFAGFMSREKIGYGDGAMVMVCGIFLGLAANLELVCVSFILLEMVALFLVVIKRKGRRYQIPFVPFLLAGYLTLLI